jgi:hypothetical protein
MLYSALAHLFALVLDLLALVRRSDQAKDLEILALRQQLPHLQCDGRMCAGCGSAGAFVCTTRSLLWWRRP